MKQEKDEIDKLFENFLTEAPEKPTVDPKVIEHILEMSDKHTYLPHQGTGLCILWILVKKQNCSN